MILLDTDTLTLLLRGNEPLALILFLPRLPLESWLVDARIVVESRAGSR